MPNRQFRFRVLVSCQALMFTASGLVAVQAQDTTALALVSIALVAFEVLSLAAFNAVLNQRGPHGA